MISSASCPCDPIDLKRGNVTYFTHLNYENTVIGNEGRKMNSLLRQTSENSAERCRRKGN